MPLSNQPLTTGSQGAEVKLLHLQLQRLGRQIAPEELNSSTYEKITAGSVAELQKK